MNKYVTFCGKVLSNRYFNFLLSFLGCVGQVLLSLFYTRNVRCRELPSTHLIGRSHCAMLCCVCAAVSED